MKHNPREYDKEVVSCIVKGVAYPNAYIRTFNNDVRISHRGREGYLHYYYWVDEVYNFKVIKIRKTVPIVIAKMMANEGIPVSPYSWKNSSYISHEGYKRYKNIFDYNKLKWTKTQMFLYQYDKYPVYKKIKFVFVDQKGVAYTESMLMKLLKKYY